MNTRRVKAIFLSSTKKFWRDKAAVFWTIAWPIMLVVLSAFVFIPPSTGKPLQLEVGVINFDNSDTPFNGKDFVKVLKTVEYNGTKLFNVTEYSNVTKMMQDLNRTRIDAAIIIPENFGKQLMFSTANITVYVGGDSLYSIQVNKGVLQAFFYEFSQRASLQKINASLSFINLGSLPSGIEIETPLGNMTFLEIMTNYLKGIAIPVNATIIESPPEILSQRNLVLGWYTLGAVGMMILYTGFLMGAISIVEEKEKGRLDRLLSTPLKPSELLLGKMLYALAILLMSSTIIAITGYSLGAKIRWSPTSIADLIVILMLVLTATMTISIGFLISLITRTQTSAGNISVILGLFLSFTAGIFFPRDWLPPVLRTLADSFPVTWGLDVIRSIMVYQTPLAELSIDIVKVIVSSIILFVVGLIAYKKTLSRYAEV